MPGLSRKVLVYAATDGLIIRPLTPRGQGHRPLDPVIVKYGSASLSPASVTQIPVSVESPGPWFEAFGVVGLITVSGLSFLVTITRCERVADITGHTVYVVTRVAVTPCSSYAEAEESTRKTGVHLQARASPPCRVPNGDEDEDSPSSDDEVEIQDLANLAIDEVDDALPSDANAVLDLDPTRSSVVEDVIRRKGTYGRFAQRWFSRCGWTLEQRRTLGLTNSPTMSPSPMASPASPYLMPQNTSAPVGDAGRNVNRRVPPVSTLLPKLLSTMQVLFGSSRSFYFSYDMDITRRRTSKAPSFPAETPLHARVDPVFFWNRHILKPFLEAGCDALALPLMQGFVGQKHFVVDSHPPQVDVDIKSSESVELADLSPAQSPPSSPIASAGALDRGRLLRPSERRYQITLISRRSTKRAGLRYLRRGVDEDGFVANSVETEQILSSPSPSWNDYPVYSFLQIRGSIPLFFTQSPYSLKPVPVLQHSDEANFKALKLHFERLLQEFGSLQVVNLVEKQNMEGPLGSKFQDSVERLNQDLSDENRVAFKWFDFHHVCRGMKFENVSILLSLLKDKIEELGSTIEKDGALVQNQRGVLRTNCMDCLDRTNVCQSSFAKHMLDWQLRQEGIEMEAQRDQENAWFNILWADNGDAVSKQYASTAAMKGDYTRTRKRDYRGALNDLGLSVARLYSGMVNDYFSQAAIDFLLGNVTDKVFDEFEADMMTKDPAVSVEKMRERAIELCQRRVVADAREDVHGCWVLLSPKMAKIVNKPSPMEEVVFLLTDAALYLCRFNWDLDKVSSFERVSLASITGIVRGIYITSTVSPLHVDEAKNVGFLVTYHPGLSDVRRTNTRTLSTSGGIVPTAGATVAVQEEPSVLGALLAGRPEQPETRKLALKAPYADSSTAATRPGPGPRQTEEEMVATICAEIERLVFERQPFKAVEGRGPLIEAGDIISLDDAKRNTGYLEQLGHSLKRLVWA